MSDQTNSCACGMCFFLAAPGSRYCKHHRSAGEAFDAKLMTNANPTVEAQGKPDSEPRPECEYQGDGWGACQKCHLPPSADSHAVERVQPEPVSPICECGHHKNYICHAKNNELAAASNCCCGGYQPVSPQEKRTVNQSSLACNLSLGTDVRTTSPSTNVEIPAEKYRLLQEVREAGWGAWAYVNCEVLRINLRDALEKLCDFEDGEAAFPSNEGLEQEIAEWWSRKGSQFHDDAPGAIVAFVREREKR